MSVNRRVVLSLSSLRHSWVAAALALTACALVLLFAIVPHGIFGDGYVRFVKLDELLRHGSLSAKRYSYIGPLFASPFWVLGGARMWWCERFNVLVLGVGLGAAWWALRPASTSNERATAALLLAATGMLPNATLDFYGELFSTMTVGTVLLLVTTRNSWLGWIAVVLGVANTPATIGGLLLVAMWRFWSSRTFDGFIATAVAATLILAENTIVRGAPFNAGYLLDRGAVTVMPYSGIPGFSYPLIFGAFSLLFSCGKGLLFFAPGLLTVARARRDRPQLAPFFDLSIAFLAGLVLVYAQYWSWYGGWKWGPRYLLFASYPSSLALAIALETRSAALAAIAIAIWTVWTVWVGVSGVVFDLKGLETCIANGYALEHLCWYVPDFSPLLRPLILPPGPLVAWQKIWMSLAAVVTIVVTTRGSLDAPRSG